MNEEKDLGAVEVNTEATQESSTEAVQEVEKLSLRDALEVAIKTHEDAPKDASKDELSTKPVEKTLATDRTRAPRAEKKTSEPAQKIEYTPPAEYSKEEAEDFKRLPPEAQKAALRLHTSRNRTIEQIRREAAAVNQEKEQLKWARDVVKELEPYLKTNGRGERGPAHAEIVKALKLVNEFDADPKATAAAILRAKGVEVPEALVEKSEPVSKEIRALQSEIEALKLDRVKEVQEKTTNVALSAWTAFDSEKNAAGEKKYPDINETESGLKLARQIGSLVFDDTPLAKQFVASVQSRIPNLTYERLIQEAYKYFGGTVNDAPASSPTRTASDKQHLARSSRAASSVPGRSSATTSSNSSGVKKYKTTREAAAAALAELREAEGH